MPLTSYRDGFGNWCTRIVAPHGPDPAVGRARSCNDSGLPGAGSRSRTAQHAVQDLPEECLLFLLGSRYCETDRLSDVAWSLFEHSPRGAQRVQAICDYVHRHITFGYENARSTQDGAGRRSTRGRASAATTRIWRSPSAAA